MSTVGPALPPHLAAKRKRQAETAEGQLQETRDVPRPLVNAAAQESEASESSDSTTKRRKVVVGPAPPPAPLHERPPGAPSDDSDESSDDDYGPSMPSHQGPQKSAFDDVTRSAGHTYRTEGDGQPKRDDWMMVPPDKDDLAARMDPTKLRARKFNTGRAGGAANNPGGIGATWSETPEEKKKRLEDEILGVTATASSGNNTDAAAEAKRRRRREDEETARRIKEHTERQQEPKKSLYEDHKGTKASEKEDDPSKRAFDREKDIGGVKIGHAQRRELMQKVKGGFSSKFSGGGYL